MTMKGPKPVNMRCKPSLFALEMMEYIHPAMVIFMMSKAVEGVDMAVGEVYRDNDIAVYLEGYTGDIYVASYAGDDGKPMTERYGNIESMLKYKRDGSYTGVKMTPEQIKAIDEWDQRGTKA
jgi:hypothetical protein